MSGATLAAETTPPADATPGSALWNSARSHITMYTEAVRRDRPYAPALNERALDYQATRAAEAASRLRRPGCTVLNDPTGTGKTAVALVAARLVLSGWADIAKVTRVLVIAPSRTVAEAWVGRARYVGFPDSHVELFAGVGHRSRARVVVTTRQLTPRQPLTSDPARLLVIVDEAHRGLSSAEGSRERIAAIAAGSRLLLVSASPFQLDATSFAQMLEIATPRESREAVIDVDRVAISQYATAMVEKLAATMAVTAKPGDAELLDRLEHTRQREVSLRAARDRALSPHFMSRYNTQEIGLPAQFPSAVPPKTPIPPGRQWATFYHVGRVLPELVKTGQASDTFLRMLGSSHLAFSDTAVFKEFATLTDSALVAEMARMLSGSELTHPKVAATARWTVERLRQGRHVLVFCVYRRTQEALVEAIREHSGEASAVEGPSSAREAERHRRNRFGQQPGGSTTPMALVVRDNLSEAIDLDGGRPCIVHHDLAWNPARFVQRMGRVTRASSGFWVPPKTDVFIPVLELGLDNRMYDTMSNRSLLAESVLGLLPDSEGPAEA